MLKRKEENNPSWLMSVDITGAERAQWKLMKYQELSANTVAFVSYRCGLCTFTATSIANESHSVGWKFLIFHQFLLGLFCYSDIYRFESGRCRSLPFFNIFYYFPFPGFPFILIKSSKCAKSDCGCCISLFDFSLVLKFEHKFLSQYLDRREIVMLNKSVHILYHLLNTPVVIKYRILSEKTP